MHKTPEEKIEQIRKLYAQGVTQKKIQEITGISSHTIYRYTREDIGTATTKNKMPEEFKKEWDEARKKILRQKGKEKPKRKGIIVLDLPKNCRVCRFYYAARDMHTGKYAGGCRIISTAMIRNTDKKPDWCPIKPTPEKIKKEKGLHGTEEIIQESARRGWNACINQILEEGKRE